MKIRFRTPLHSKRGLTLIEVLGSLTLLATVLAVLLTARGRFMLQAAEADRRLAASEAVEAMLTRWYSEHGEIPVGEGGELVVRFGEPLYWRTDPLPDEQAASLGLQRIRLVVRRADRQPATAPEAAVRPVLHIELVQGATRGDGKPTQPLE